MRYIIPSSNIKNFVKIFLIKQKEREEKLHDGKPDEEGWVRVTRKGKNPSFTRSEANEVKVRAQLKRKQEKQKVCAWHNYFALNNTNWVNWFF